jgi:rhamnulokinase
MVHKKIYLALDLGAESGRVLAGEYNGSTLELVPINTFPNGPIDLGGNMHWNTTGL